MSVKATRNDLTCRPPRLSSHQEDGRSRRWVASTTCQPSSTWVSHSSSSNTKSDNRPILLGRRNEALPIVVPSIITKRPFFASSTDHTTLLQNAEVHRLLVGQAVGGGRDAPPQYQYVLVAQGTEVGLVQKVPQLHLARLWWDPSTNTIYGAKVVNRTLGSIPEVCPRLLDAALKDAIKASSAERSTFSIQGRSTLHGLSEWVLQQNRDSNNHKHKDEEKVPAMARGGEFKKDEYDQAEWERVATKFVHNGQSVESNLYQSRGGVLSHIEHHCDTSDFASSSRGAMAVFQFSSST
jgi:hypothetical protein